MYPWKKEPVPKGCEDCKLLLKEQRKEGDTHFKENVVMWIVQVISMYENMDQARQGHTVRKRNKKFSIQFTKRV